MGAAATSRRDHGDLRDSLRALKAGSSYCLDVPITADGGGEVHARVIPGLRLTVAWFFQGPDFPSSLEVVTQLLGR
jgi:hypothetical protein